MQAEPKAPLPPHASDCPFCPGNEQGTPDETYRRPVDGRWAVRCFPNKFSALSAEGKLWRATRGTKVSAAAVGLHEIIVEGERHDLSLALLSDAQNAEVVHAYHHRFRALYQDPRVEYVSLFKNHGVTAGTSLDHPHAQIVGLPMPPKLLLRQLEEGLQYFGRKGSCLVCTILDEEVSMGERMVLESPHFVVFVPYAALFPWHLWVFPKRHSGSFDDTSEEERDDLARSLGAALFKLFSGLDDPPYNLMLFSAPPNETQLPYLHWYFSIIPRITTGAGFEFGTGMYINPHYPEADAELLRSIQKPDL